MKSIYLLLLINTYAVFSFNYLKFNNKFRTKKSILFSNKYNNIYLNKNNSRVLQTSIYLESLEKKNIYNNPKIVTNISFDNIMLYNNYIETIYDNKNQFLIIEFKNNTRHIYYYINNYLHINEIIKNSNIYYINLHDYPKYIINSPFGFLHLKKNNNN
tara:strand:+ start:1191 stop:1664 length:474 start_codon:yes stop_codon:yes gene_type:complete